MAKVKVYSTTTCPYCHLLKQYLTSHDVQFEDIVLDAQPDRVQAFVDECGSMAVPCTHITSDSGDDTVIVGFDQPAINKALGLTAAR